MGMVVKVDKAKKIMWNNSRNEEENSIISSMTFLDETRHVAIVDVWGIERVATHHSLTTLLDIKKL